MYGGFSVMFVAAEVLLNEVPVFAMTIPFVIVFCGPK